MVCRSILDFGFSLDLRSCQRKLYMYIWVGGRILTYYVGVINRQKVVHPGHHAHDYEIVSTSFILMEEVTLHL